MITSLSCVCGSRQIGYLLTPANAITLFLAINRNKSYDTDSVTVQLNNAEIPRVEKTKFLGVIVDSKLHVTWKFHTRAREKDIKEQWYYF